MTTTAEQFKAKFGPDGRLLTCDETVDVVFATRGGSRFPGKLQFQDGLCVHSEIRLGRNWTQSGDSPVNGVHTLLDLGEETPQEIVIHQGLISFIDAPKRQSTKQDFLRSLRVARNLFAHSQMVPADRLTVDPIVDSATRTRVATWLTTRSVAGFDEVDFAELGRHRQAELRAAVQDFKKVAVQVPADQPATSQQYNVASTALRQILDIVAPYLPLSAEARQVEEALRGVDFPPWVVNWDYELASDSEGADAVWVDIYVGERTFQPGQLGRAASELSFMVRQALDAREIDRWPLIRLGTVLEHKVG